MARPCIFVGPPWKREETWIFSWLFWSLDQTWVSLVATIFSMPLLNSESKNLLKTCQKLYTRFRVRRLYRIWVIVGPLTHYVFNWDSTKAPLGGTVHGEKYRKCSVRLRQQNLKLKRGLKSNIKLNTSSRLLIFNLWYFNLYPFYF